MAWHKVQSLPFNFLLGPLLIGLLKPDTFFLFSFISIEFLTSHTFLFSFVHRLQNLLLFFLPLFTMLSILTCPPTHTHTYAHKHTHSLTHSLRNPDVDARNVSAALLTQSLMPSSGPWGGQSHGTWHSCTLLLACFIFLSWHCSGHPGREPVQLLLIPLLSIRTP